MGIDERKGIEGRQPNDHDCNSGGNACRTQLQHRTHRAYNGPVTKRTKKTHTIVILTFIMTVPCLSCARTGFGGFTNGAGDTDRPTSHGAQGDTAIPGDTNPTGDSLPIDEGDATPGPTTFPGELAQVPGVSLGQSMPVDNFRMHPDGSSLIYTARRTSPTRYGLYEVNIDGTGTRRLNPPLPANEKVARFYITTNGSWTLFNAPRYRGYDELYAIRIDQTVPQAPRRISAPLRRNRIHDYGVPGFWANEENSRVLYLGNGVASNEKDVFVVGFDGANATLLSTSQVESHTPTPASISPDGVNVAYHEQGSRLQLASSDGLQHTTLHSFAVFELQRGAKSTFMPDGSRILFMRYSTDWAAPFAHKLHSFDLAGIDPVDITPGNVTCAKVVASADSSQIMLLSDHTVEGLLELHVALPDGSGLLRVQAGPISDFSVTSGEGTVIFTADRLFDDGLELYAAPSAGGLPWLLSPNTAGSVSEYATSSDGLRTVFVFRDAATQIPEIYSVTSDGSEVPAAFEIGAQAFTQVTAVTDNYEYLSMGPGPQIAPDGLTVAYYADVAQDGVFNLYSKSIGQAAVNHSVPQYQVAPFFEDLVHTSTHKFAVFLASFDAGISSLYAVTDDAARLFKVNGDEANEGVVLGFGLSPNGQFVVYRTIGSHLFIRDLTASAPLKLEVGPELGGANAPTYGSPLLSNDSRHVVFSAQGDLWGLYVAPLDGSSAPRLIYTAPNADARIGNVLLTQDSQTVIFQIAGTGVPSNLYAAALDGSDTRQLTFNTTAEQGVSGPAQLSADGTRVVYNNFEGLISPRRYTLYSAPVDGSATPVALGPAPFRGDFWMPKAGDAVIVRSYWDNPAFQPEYFGLPIAGGAHYRLHDTSNPTFFVRRPTMAPAGDSLLFHANFDADDAWEIFGVRADGSGRAMINGPISTEQIVHEAVFSADGSKVYYVLDETTHGEFDLYAANSDGTQRARLTGPYASGGGLLDYITLASHRVIFHASQDNAEIGELYVIDDDGSGLTKLSPPMAPGGNILRFTAAPDGLSVLFLVQHDALSKPLLYRTRLDNSPPVLLPSGATDAEVVSDFIAFPNSVVVFSNFHNAQEARIFGYAQ